MTRTLLDVARAYWPANTYYTPVDLLLLDGADIYGQSNPPFRADALDTPTAPGKTLPASVIVERLDQTRLAGPRMYQTAHLASPLRKEHMNTLTPPVTAPTAPAPLFILTPAVIILAGAEMRRIVAAEPAAPFARASRRFGDLMVELVRSHRTWRLYLADLAPVKHTRRDLWATAVSAPSVEWMRTQDGCLVWCEWTEPAA